MCGLVGFLGEVSIQGTPENEKLLKQMADTIQHRGPDDGGYWCDVDKNIGLGHRRLSIVDLSPAGHQPMHSTSERYVLVFNGEIYNHLNLRSELEKSGNIAWRGHSDTETLLAGFTAWGIQGTLERSIGMFAIAVWDRQTSSLTLARDRIGEKPLYYGWQGSGNSAVFLFGSELKALRAHPAFRAEVDRGALSLLLRHNYVPAPYSIFKGISKLNPGCLLTVSMHHREPEVVTYWSGAQAAISGVANRFTGSATQAVDELETLLKDAVRQQMMADVPLGAFLSGGVDSSTVVALMQMQSPRPVKTFTIGFNEAGYNEALHAKAVAKHLGTEHTELYVTAEQAMAVIPRLPALYDEPFADSSQIPTFLVSQLARQHVTVSLSGDAGDELFCGYTRYQMTANHWHKMSLLSVPLRKLIAQGLKGVSPQAWNRLAAVLPRSMNGTNIGNKLHKGANLLASGSVDALYLGLVSHWHDPASVVIGGLEPATLLTGNAPDLPALDEIERMMALDMLTYLPDDILAKVDRASMGVSLESRVPFLDHRVVEFAWRLPQAMKLREGQTKWALRQVLYRHVPKELIERPKMGFAVPLQDWLRGPLRDWAESLLDEARLEREGYFHPAPIRQKWAEHLSGQRNWTPHLWCVLMFQAWLEENGPAT
ncbi:asparagine synthase (glutamine-hydrolyzing) [Polaromonas sp.]|uniref:asparagine synthase (glutamine-hydrolyzing) n=1 Tax=Polaromonas sp. TaxID=1869339 RepID=UPI0013BC8785|nr:asparagine synthase (glutamine-hydrolyzing) [Polaromonas sp.]NDP61890.1 asparagine synthase (glutamine-hydrolyzing) [Polaromonas sp.]